MNLAFLQRWRRKNKPPKDAAYPTLPQFSRAYNELDAASEMHLDLVEVNFKAWEADLREQLSDLNQRASRNIVGPSLVFAVLAALLTLGGEKTPPSELFRWGVGFLAGFAVLVLFSAGFALRSMALRGGGYLHPTTIVTGGTHRFAPRRYRQGVLKARIVAQERLYKLHRSKSGWMKWSESTMTAALLLAAVGLVLCAAALLTQSQ